MADPPARRPGELATYRLRHCPAGVLRCAALVLQLAADLGSGASSLHLRLSRGINPAPVSGLRMMVACYLAALVAAGWGTWKLLRKTW